MVVLDRGLDGVDEVVDGAPFEISFQKDARVVVVVGKAVVHVGS